MACFNLGVLYAKGETVKKDLKKAEKFFKRSCEMGFKKGCNVIIAK